MSPKYAPYTPRADGHGSAYALDAVTGQLRWKANVGDFNRDDHNDIVSGPSWYEGLDFKQRHEFRPARRVKFLKFLIDLKDGRPVGNLRDLDSFVTMSTISTPMDGPISYQSTYRAKMPDELAFACRP